MLVVEQIFDTDETDKTMSLVFFHFQPFVLVDGLIVGKTSTQRPDTLLRKYQNSLDKP